MIDFLNINLLAAVTTIYQVKLDQLMTVFFWLKTYNNFKLTKNEFVWYTKVNFLIVNATKQSIKEC